MVKTFAGSTVNGYADGLGNQAKFKYLEGITQNTQGAFFVADHFNNRIRKIDGFGQVTTFAGDGTAGCKAGLGVNASIAGPMCIAADINGNIYVSGNSDKTIFKIDSTGLVSIYFGSGSGKTGTFGYITGIAVDNQNNLFVTDMNTYTISKITPSGQMVILAGDPSVKKTIDGGTSKARFTKPYGITIDADGNFYIIDNYCIRKIEKVN